MPPMKFKERLARPLLAVTMAAMLTCAIFISVFASTGAEASFATYEKGDKFALKGEKDLSLGYYAANQLLTFGDEEELIRDMVIDNASMSGYMSSVMIFEVIEVTDDEYVMKITTAENLTMAVQFMLIGEMVDPGEYIAQWDEGDSTNPDNLINISDADATVRTLGFDAKLAAGANATYIVHMQKSDMAIKSMEMSACMYARGYLDLRNYPNSTSDYNETTELDVITINSYESSMSNISLDLNLNGEMRFDPYITAVRDGPAEDSTWEVDTFVNGTFTWTGMLDVTGAPQEFLDGMFDDDAAEWGITGFPINLAEIYDPYDATPRIDNGTLAISAEPVDFEFSNLGNDVINDPVYGNITIYRLGFNNATERNPLEAWYYPAEGSLVGFELNYQIGEMIWITLDMKSVTVEDAQKAVSGISEQIADKKTYDQINQPTNPGDSTNGLMSLLPIIALIAVAVIAVVGIVFVMKRRSKPKA